MPDLTAGQLPRLQNHRLPGLDLGEEFIYPKYDNQSILNLPSTVCHLLGVPGLGAGPLAPEILTPLGAARRVIMVLMDALALHRLRQWSMDGTAPLWARLAEQGWLVPLTSIVPSTTSSALTTLWTGRSTAEHGVAGYELWLKEYGVVANMIFHSPASFQNEMGTLSKAGFKPETFLPFPTLGTHLLEHGVNSYAFQHRSIAKSLLSQMLFKDVEVLSIGTPADLWVNVRLLLQNRPAEQQYIWVYWGELDHYSHYYGPDDEHPAAEFSSFTHALENQLLNRLSPQSRQDTLLILTADHGAISTLWKANYELSDHPGFTRQLHILPTGEGRFAYLHQHPGQSDVIRKYIERAWPGQFRLVDPAFAVAKGLFGPGEPHPRLADRLGEAIAVSRGQAYWWWADKENRLLGRHGGLSAEEMLVPFLAVRL